MTLHEVAQQRVYMKGACALHDPGVSYGVLRRRHVSFRRQSITISRRSVVTG